MFAIAALTVVLAFGVNAVSHVVLLLRHHPLVREHRGTLQFVSAWVGDGLLLPAMNLAGADVFRRTGGRPSAGDLAAASVVSGAITASMHIGQAAGGHVNWSMPAPWRWNVLGWYHLIFMWGQLTWLTAALLRIAQRHSLDRATVRDGAVIGLGLILFAGLLRWDYRAQ